MIVEVQYLIIHHTATKEDISIENMKKSMTRTHWRIPAHYIIDYAGNIKKTEEHTINVWGTMSHYHNQRAIQVELIGNFEYIDPSNEQYLALNRLLKDLQKDYPKIKWIWHKDASPSKCPWKNFNIDLVGKDLQVFNLTRYYSVEPNQKRYFTSKTWYISDHYRDMYKNYERWYEQDVCMNCGCDLHWAKRLHSCLHTSSWLPLKNKYARKVVACPREYPIGTKFYVSWLWFLECMDRGWAIRGNRLDVRMWFGDYALDNWDWSYAWPRLWYVLD